MIIAVVCAEELSQSRREIGLDSLCCILGLCPKYSVIFYRDILAKLCCYSV
jgi:hypothetical protein